jgi:hypothetical protein
MVAAAASRGVSGTEIVVGTVADLSRVTGVQGVNNAKAIYLAYDEANTSSGIRGRGTPQLRENAPLPGRPSAATCRPSEQVRKANLTSPHRVASGHDATPGGRPALSGRQMIDLDQCNRESAMPEHLSFYTWCLGCFSAHSLGIKYEQDGSRQDTDRR